MPHSSRATGHATLLLNKGARSRRLTVERPVVDAKGMQWSIINCFRTVHMVTALLEECFRTAPCARPITIVGTAQLQARWWKHESFKGRLR